MTGPEYTAVEEALAKLSASELTAIWRARYTSARVAADDEDDFGVLLYTVMRRRKLIKWNAFGEVWLAEEL